jgi:hypothetical protein
MGKHTPGPWSKSERGYIFAGDSCIASTSDLDENEANARLIAAAPDLLAALEQSLSWLSSYPGGGANAAWRKASEAIAKARGE